MRDSLNIYEQIDNYLSNNMSADEVAAFKIQIKESSELQQMVENQQLMIQAQQRKVLRSEIEAIAKGGGFPYGKFIGVVGTIVLIVSVLLFVLNVDNKTLQEDIVSVPVVISEESLVEDSLVVQEVILDSLMEESAIDSNAISKTKSTSANDGHYYSEDTECGGHKTWVEPDRQKFTIDPNKGKTIEGKQGMLVIVPKDAFVDAEGNLVESPVELELVEALTLEDMVLYDLATLSNGKQLESGGMFYLEAKSKGKIVQINPERPFYIEIPTNEVKPGMMAFKGEVDENGKLNWVDPKPLKKYLAKVDLNQLDFLPEGFDVGVEDGIPFKGHVEADKNLVDSLYYSLGNIENVEDVESSNLKDLDGIFFSSMNINRVGKGKKEVSLTAYLDTTVISEKKEYLYNPRLTEFTGSMVIQDRKGNLKVISKRDGEIIYPDEIQGFNNYNGEISNLSRVGDIDGFSNIEKEEKEIQIVNTPKLNSKTSSLSSSSNEITSNKCGINPLSIKTIKTNGFKETYIATQEFEERVAMLHKLNNGQALLGVYLNRLGEDMYVSDSIVMTKVKGDFKTVFRNYYNQKLTNLKDAEIHQEQLSAYYNKKKKEYANSIQKLRNELNKKDLEEIKQLKEQINVARKNYTATLVLSSPQETTNNSNSKRANAVANLVSKLPRRNVVNSPSTYSMPWASTGWANIDSYLHMLSKGSENVEILAKNGDESTQVYQWLNAINTLTPLVVSNGTAQAKFPKRGSKNANQMKNTFCFAISKKNGIFKWCKRVFNPYQSGTLIAELQTTSLEDVKYDLRVLGVKENNVFNHLNKIEARLIKEVREREERERKAEQIRIAKDAYLEKTKEVNAKINAINMRLKTERLFIESLRQIAFPCNSENEAESVEIVEPVIMSQVVAPTVYSPNGDGKNKGFLPSGEILLSGSYNIKIINSKSEVVYSNNSRTPWNGKMNNTGKWCRGGDYVWEIRHTGDKGEVHKFKGNLLLLAGEN